MGTDWVKVTLQIVGGLGVAAGVLMGLSSLLWLISGEGAQAGISLVWTIVFVTVAAGLFGMARVFARNRSDI